MKRLLWATDLAIVASWFFSSFLTQLLPTAVSSWVTFVFLAVYVAVISIAYPSARLHLRSDRASGVALVVGLVFVAFLYEPVLFGRSTLVPASAAFVASTVVYSILYALFLQVFLLNLNTRGRFDRQRPGALTLPYLLFLILLLPLSTLRTLALGTPPEILSFVITDLFGGTALFLVLVLLYAKSQFNNFPGLLFYLATTIPSTVTVLVTANPVLELGWLFAAYAVAIVLIEVLLPATWLERRLFPVVRGPTFGQSHRGTVATVAAVGAFALTLLVIVPVVLGTPEPYYADATGSMAPQIEPGSLLIVHHVSVGSITVGEILVFTAAWASNLTVAHEVIAILHTPAGLAFQTRGIANPGPDPAPVPAGDVIGIVAFVVPWVGYLVLYDFAVVVVTAVAIGAYAAYSVMHPRRTHWRSPRRAY